MAIAERTPTAPSGALERVYVLIADNVKAKLYRSKIPFQELDLISIRVNFTGGSAKMWSHSKRKKEEARPLTAPSAEGMEFFRTLCLVLRSEYQAGKFDGLMLVVRPEFLAVTHGLLEGISNGRTYIQAAEEPGQSTEQELLARLREKFAVV